MHRKRDIPWLQVVRFHKEVTRRAEEAFFALPAERVDSDRWSSLKEFEPDSFSGPWYLNPHALVSAPLARAIKREETEEVFLGGPCWSRWVPAGRGKFRLEWLPVLYRQVHVLLDSDSVSIVPDQGKWEISPLVYSLLDRKNAQPEQPLEEWLPELMEKAQALASADGVDLTDALVDTLSRNIPELGEELEKPIPNRVSVTPSPWVVFTPPSSSSVIYRHLMSDYEKLEQVLERRSHAIGGFELLEDVAAAENQTSGAVLPIVPLNDSQHEAVSGILAGKPVTVISGPPGTGKSQVVVSALLNAWSEGKSVLFASNNNQAVNVVRERIKKFEDEFPIAIRAGARKASELDDAFRRTLNVIASAASDPSFDQTVVLTRQKALQRDKRAIEQFLDGKLPQRLHESLASALNAYGQYQRVLGELGEAGSELRENLGKLGYSVPTESFERLVFEPLQSWVEGSHDAEREIAEAERQRRHCEREEEAAGAARNRSVQTQGLDAAQAGNWEWLVAAPGPESLEAWVRGFQGLIGEPLDRDLARFDWEEEFDRWGSSNEAAEWSGTARKLLSEVRAAYGRLEVLANEVISARTERDQQMAVIRALGVPEGVQLEPSDLGNWSAFYSEYCTLPKTIISWLPWSTKSRLKRALRKVERAFRPAFPLSMWQRIGRLDEDGRAKLGEVIEATARWIEVSEAWDATGPQRDEIRATLGAFRAAGGSLGLGFVPPSDDVDQWRKFGDTLADRQRLGEAAALAWKRREAQEDARQRLRAAVEEYDAVASGIPLREAWVNGIGASFHSAVRSLAANARPQDVVAARSALYTEPVTGLLEAWQQARDFEVQVRSARSAAAALPTQSELIAAWWDRKPDPIPVLTGTREHLPADGDAVFEHYQSCQEWLELWQRFTSTTRPKLEEGVAGERRWAREKLVEAGEGVPRSEVGRTIQALITRTVENDADDWPTAELQETFAEFDPVRIKARIDTIDHQLETLAFDLAKARWVRQLSADPEIQAVLETLLKRYQASRGSIAPKDYPLFEQVLRAIPIWIITALSPQSLPLIPHLFDVLVIDEATQCTVTNLLPLIYRAKSLVVIGDREQLAAIPTLTPGAEQALARNFDLEEWLDLLGHSQNTVYSTAVHCLPRRYSDVISLKEHYRSHPLIIGFSNRHVYQKHLRLRKDPSEAVNIPVGAGLHGVNVSGSCERGERGRSWRNPAEAKRVVELIQELRADDNASGFTIGVVTPFRAQGELIDQRLSSLRTAE